MVVMVNVLNSRFHVSILEWKKNIIGKQLIDILLSTGISEVIHQFIVVWFLNRYIYDVDVKTI